MASVFGLRTPGTGISGIEDWRPRWAGGPSQPQLDPQVPKLHLSPISHTSTPEASFPLRHWMQNWASSIPILGYSLQHPEHSLMSSDGDLWAYPTIPFQPLLTLDPSPPDLGRSCHPTSVPHWPATAFRDPANSSTFSAENYSPTLTQRGWQPPPDLHKGGMSGMSWNTGPASQNCQAPLAPEGPDNVRVLNPKPPR